jgi:peptidoglycan-N-acetylglucosamine deacetylase
MENLDEGQRTDQNTVMSIMLFLTFFLHSSTFAREIALTFDDAPTSSSSVYTSEARTREFIRLFRELSIPQVMIFANACKKSDRKSLRSQLGEYVSAGHLIGNHTCRHFRFDEVGFENFSADATLGEKNLGDLLSTPKFFRFPYLNEGTTERRRDEMRSWLLKNKYRQGYVSVDNDDYFFTSRLRTAQEAGKKFDLKKVETLFVSHIADAADYYDDLAVKTLGRSPRHVLLLHELDATLMFLGPLVQELRKRGWKIISISEAYQDTMYLEVPKNLYANNGIIAQLAKEKTGTEVRPQHFAHMKKELDRILKLDGTP